MSEDDCFPRRCKLHGARVVVMAEDESSSSSFWVPTVTVYDASTWTDAMSACIRERFPDDVVGSISVKQSSSSLSGFAVTVTLTGGSLGGEEERGDAMQTWWRRHRHHAQGLLLLLVGIACAVWMTRMEGASATGRVEL